MLRPPVTRKTLSWMNRPYVPRILGLVILLVGLALTLLYSYVLFHTLAELFTVVVAFGVFMTIWNARKWVDNDYALFIGIGFAFVGITDLMHTLAYPGMSVFHDYDANLPTHLWLTARYLQSTTLLIAPFLIGRRLRAEFVLIGSCVIALILLGMIFGDVLPHSSVDGVEATPLNTSSDFAICLMLIGSIIVFVRQRRHFDRQILNLLVLSNVAMIGAMITFTSYLVNYDSANLVGHNFKIIAFFLVYLAMIEIGLEKPHDLVFRNLKQSEAALRLSEQRLRALTQASPALLWEIDVEGVVRFANRAYHGVTPAQVVGTPIRRWLGHAQGVDITHWLERAFATKQPQAFEYMAPNSQGEIRTYWTELAPIKLAEEIQTAVLSTMDITEPKSRERQLEHLYQELENERGKLQAIFHSAPEGIVVIDSESRVVMFNSSANKLFGRDVPLGESLASFTDMQPCYPDGTPYASRDFPLTRSAMVGETYSNVEILIHLLDGTSRNLLANSAPIRDNQGNITSAVGVFQDVTALKTIQQDLIKALQDSRQRQTEISALLDASRAILENRVFKNAAGTIFGTCKKLLGARMGYVALRTSSSTTDVVHWLDFGDRTRGGDPPMMLPLRSIHEQACGRGTPYYENNFAASDWLRLLPAGHRVIENLLLAPMMINGKLTGVLGFANKPDGFTEHDARIATTFSELASVALVNSQAEEMLQHSHDELEARVAERTAELEKANAAQNESRERMAQVIQASNDGYWEWEIPSGDVWMSQRWYEILGYHEKDFISNIRHLDLLVYPGDVARIANIVHPCLQGTSGSNRYEVEQRYRTKQGDWKWVWVKGLVTQRDQAGKAVRVVGIMSDIAERKRAETEIRQNAARAEAMANTAGRLNGQLNLTRIINAVCEEVTRALDVPAAWVGIYDQKKGNLGFAASFGLADEFGQRIKFDANQDHDEYANQVHRLVVESDVRHLTDSPNQKLYAAMNVCSIASSSLYYEDKFLGVLCVLTFGKVRQFSQGELDLLQGIANQAALAITNVRSWQDEQMARQIAETLTAANLALGQTLNPDQVLNTLLEHLGRVVPFDSANVMLLENEFSLTLRVLQGYEKYTNRDQVSKVVIDIRTNPILQQLITTQRSVLIPDTAKEPNWERHPVVDSVRSWLGVPLVVSGTVIGLYSVDKAIPGFFTEEHLRLASAFAPGAAVALQNAWLFAQVRAGRERLQALSHRLIEIQETERRYIARELHDEAGQLLTSMILDLHLIESDLSKPELIHNRLAELKQSAESVLENLHRLAMDLRPVSLDRLGLIPALQQYIERVNARWNLKIELAAIGFEGTRLPTSIETMMYRVLQETLTNVVKHAHASRADVVLEQRGDRVIAVVEDNGIGFDVDAALQKGRLGLIGMKERVELIGGNLVIESSPGTSTIMRVEVPYDSPNPNRG